MRESDVRFWPFAASAILRSNHVQCFYDCALKLLRVILVDLMPRMFKYEKRLLWRLQPLETGLRDARGSLEIPGADHKIDWAIDFRQ